LTVKPPGMMLSDLAIELSKPSGFRASKVLNKNCKVAPMEVEEM